MQKFKVADGANPDGTAKDGVIGVSAGTKYKAAAWNDNFFNIFDFVEGQGYSLIDDDLEQFTKASKGKYNPAYTYNTSAPATQTVADIVEGSDGLFYECQTDALTGEDPVGSVTGNWKVKRFNHIDIVNKTLSYAMTDAAIDILTNVQNQRKYLKLTGVLTADRILQVDVSIEHELVVENATTGGFSVTVQGATGTGKIVLNGTTKFLYCDGTNVILNENENVGLLAEFEVTSAVTSIDFSGLDIAKHKSYRVEIEAINATASTALISAYINGDTVATNYYSQYLQANGAAVGAARLNAATIGEISAGVGENSFIVLDIGITDGYAIALSSASRGIASTVNLFMRVMKKVATVVNITQITFTSSVASSIDIGSKIRIYRGDL